jgi:hypothetical protein
MSAATTTLNPDPLELLAGMTSEELQADLDRTLARARFLRGALAIRRRIEREEALQRRWARDDSDHPEARNP